MCCVKSVPMYEFDARKMMSAASSAAGSVRAMAIAFSAKFEAMFSRVWLAGTYLVGLVALIGFRVALSGLIKHWTREGRLDRRAVVVGGGEAGESLIEAINKQSDSDVRIVGVFDGAGDERSPTT